MKNELSFFVLRTGSGRGGKPHARRKWYRDGLAPECQCQAPAYGVRWQRLIPVDKSPCTSNPVLTRMVRTLGSHLPSNHAVRRKLMLSTQNGIRNENALASGNP